MIDLFVKICGITRLEDAELAAELGASAVGFVFWPRSPRAITPDAAKVIAAAIPPEVDKVGVFVDESPDVIRRVMDAAGLDVAQLHGRETPDDCRRLQRRVFKSVPMAPDGQVDLADYDPNVVLLLDAEDRERHGGTGRTVNWEAARAIANTRRTILAGGLTADNVMRAVRSVNPYGIDVSSGVESAPGVKDADRLRRFFEALHE